MKKLVLGSLAFASTILAANHAHAQANLLFSGGNGSLTLTLTAPVEYRVTRDPEGELSPGFVFIGTGDFTNGAGAGLMGNITFTVDGGPVQTITTLESGVSSDSDLQPTDSYIFGDLPGVGVGEIVLLTAGTLTTTGNYTGTVPASGTYETTLVDDFGNFIADARVVPEPSTWALLGLGAVGTGVMALLRRPLAAWQAKPPPAIHVRVRLQFTEKLALCCLAAAVGGGGAAPPPPPPRARGTF